MGTAATAYALLVCLILSQTYATTHFSVESPPRRTEEEMRTTYELWLARHGKTYNALGEKESRFQIFAHNLRFIDEHNFSGNRTYTVGLNQFADLTNEEYRSMYLGTKADPYRRIAKMQRGEISRRHAVQSNEMFPEKVDWRERGAVTPIKNQGGCGAVCDPIRIDVQNRAKIVSINGYEDVPPMNEKTLMKAVAHQPVSVGIEASGRAFQLYSSVNSKK
ncbi:hypothetical protein L1987_71606 [Smallanthus sonchifolius]|uniref:Uncharacterized protein n=1 Tax=Smallanthus sonchifolius TaxID=185202 RepID=A0ACB9AU92_9ASTR|nr:hypothetical protein L1987_71606 [Smallanthus sonchifolius]